LPIAEPSEAGMNAMNARKSFIADTGGAILIAGVFMTLFLIGGLFFLLGIGNALVFHDHMQEVADASAFTGAVVHARFMNMIAAINIIMLVLVAVHIALGIIHLAMFVANAVACLDPGCPDFIWPDLYAVCTGSADALDAAKAVYDGYDTILRATLWALSGLQKVLAMTAWIAAPVMSYNVANYYTDMPGGSKVLGLSEGLSIPYLGGSGKLGLPVIEETPDFLCVKLVNEFLNFIPAMPKVVKKFLGTIIGKSLKFVFCSDSLDWLPSWTTFPYCYVPLTWSEGTAGNNDSGGWWGSDKARGPKHMWEYSGDPIGNGSDYNSVYGTAVPKYTETAEKSVAIGGAIGAAGSGFGATNNYTNQTPYIAQAEFYYDCTHTWDNAKCEGDYANDNAMYTLGWRARLVRFHLPRVGMGSALAGMLNPLLSYVIIH
ncbi:MAG: hypothetical protein ABIP39_07185, partial [Polyangiaceae bacterium]